MPLTVNLTDPPGLALFQEWSGPNGTGTVMPPVGVVSYTSRNTTVATVQAVTGRLTYIAPGTTTIDGADSGNTLTASDILTIAAPAPAVSATLTLTPGP